MIEPNSKSVRVLEDASECIGATRPDGYKCARVSVCDFAQNEGSAENKELSSAKSSLSNDDFFMYRPDLFRTYNQSKNWKATIIKAPPGSGKSSLLREWQSYYDDLEYTETHFFCVSEYSNNTENKLDRIRQLAEQCRQEKGSDSDRLTHCYFLIDDFDSLGDEKVKEIFYKAIKNSPRNCHYILSGAFIADRLYVELADFQIQTVPLENLMMTRQEIEDLLGKTFPSESGALEAVDHIHWITEGWPMGLRLVVQSYEKYPQSFSFAEFNGSDELVDVFFKTTVFNRLPYDLASFSYETAMVETLNPSLCDHIINEKSSVSKLERLTEVNPFIYKVSNRGLYRYNRLYASWLQVQLLQFNNSQIRKLFTNASVWYSANNEEVQKTKMLILATDSSCLIPLLKNSGLESCITTSAELFSLVLSGKPEEISEENVHFCFLALWVYIGFGRYEEISFWTKALEKAIKTTSLQELELSYYTLTIDVAKAVAHSILFHNRESIIQCNNILNYNSSTMNAMVKFHLYYSLADDYERIGDFNRATDCCLEASAYAMACGAIDVATFPNYKRCKIMLQQGRFTEIETLAQDSIPLTNEDSPLRRAFFILLAFTQIEVLALDDAQKNIKRSLIDLVPLKNPEVYIEAQIARIDCLVSIGDFDSAHEEVVKTISMFEKNNIPAAAIGFAYVSLGRISILRNSVMGLMDCCEKLGKITASEDRYFTLYLSYFQAMLRHLEDQDDSALLMLDEIIAQAKELNLNTLFIETALQKALILEAGGNLDEAIPVFHEVLKMGQAYGYVMAIVSNGKAVFSLLKAMRAERKESPLLNEYVQSLIKALVSREEEVRTEEKTLTPRELEVLKMLNEGKTRQQISDSLFISMNTTKTHIKNINRKLNS